MSQPRVLVLGATGMLGHVAVRTLAEELDTHATVRNPSASATVPADAELHAFEAGDDPRALLDRVRPDVLVNCVGIVKQRSEGSMAVPSIAVNSLLPHRLAAACAESGARLIHVSTDCVFSGRLEPPARYTEDDLADPADLYGRSKLLGEVADGAALTLRTSIIGWELGSAFGLLEWLASQAGKSIHGFSQAWFSGLTTAALSRVIRDVIGDAPQLSGLYHVSSEAISKLDLLTRLNDSLSLGCLIEARDEPRLNRALDSSRFREATGIAIPSWNQMIAEYATEGVHEPQPR